MNLRTSFVLSACLLTGGTALADPPPDANQSLAPWYRSLRMPGAGPQPFCCDVADCRHYPVRADGTKYQVYYDNRWIDVPQEAVSNRTDNPTGDYVVCIQRNHWTDGTYDGPIVHCFIKAPRT